ncbi:MAG: hypothetical protein A2X42_05270 [Candidatus Margulisbacteria bacterium GWF2_38_17]|nr:MAG: hypothetical protein A2X43_00405 [Candidatus Margulisbacteria bacterium GWD2_39_127]OGI04311.1 MAG: hypothetical protein A2X42_05270 [Candidatus Margulisbacteria bacterium GWF2_38_17]OGI11784.1 MAG: hypothetical protein A2X41_10980 [Candidatus Margulisbacteria bacterium GWE2_39_32]
MPPHIFELEKKGSFEIDFNDPALCIAYGNDMQKFCGSHRIGFVVFENTRLPQDWIWQLKQLHQVWAPSRWAANVLLENGIPEAKVRIVPLGVDPHFFNSQGPHYSDFDNGRFKFLMVGKFEKRKSQMEVLEAYCTEFRPDDPVQLVLLCHNIKRLSLNDRATLNKYLEKPHPDIVIMNPFNDHEAVAPLYRSSNVLIAPSKAEGWGLPIIEAMACGVPVITTNYSGQSEYLRHDNPLIIDVNEYEDIYDETFYPEKGKFGVWAKLEVGELRKKMRWSFEHQEELKKIGSEDSLWIQQNWTWDSAAVKAVELLKKI